MITAVGAGEVAVVTRHGVPVAVILPVADAVRLLPPDYVMGGDLRELSERFIARARARDSSDLLHGRGYQPELR